MFTVIIAEQKVIEQYEQNKMLLAPFDSDDIVFCRWNCEGGSIDEMLPNLKKLISFNSTWRAVVVTENNTNELNPFDFVKYSNHIECGTEIKFDENFEKNCTGMFNCLDSSVNNPLTKLSYALCETPLFAERINESLEALAQNKERMLRYIFKTHFDAVNTKKLSTELRRYGVERISSFVDEESIDKLTEALCQKDYETIFNLVSEDKLIDFLKAIRIGNNATCDPGYWFSLMENTKKAQIYDDLKACYTLDTPLPTEVLYVALRTYDMRLHTNKTAWKDKDESEYSSFARYNLYNDNICFFVHDIPGGNRVDIAPEILKFHVLIQALALHGSLPSVVTKGKLYSVDIKYDMKEFSHAIAKLIVRLKATALQINEEIVAVESKKPPVIDNKTAQSLFESEIFIPVVTDKEYDYPNLRAKYDIGLFRDYPREESNYWEAQSANIKMLFKRFLREPRRAVKKACVSDLRENNTVYDFNAIGLNENQKEDIEIKLEEEELNMVSTVTKAIYDTKIFTDAIDEADEGIKRGIERRLTKKRAVVCSIFAIATFLIGFLPLIFGNLNTTKSFLFSLLITVVVLAVFAACGFLNFFVLRNKQVNRYKHFNYVMSGICKDIRASLDSFSKYLGHVCMVMRESSVLKLVGSEVDEDVQCVRILKYNLLNLEQEIDNNYKLLATLSDESVDSILSYQEKTNVLPFDNDYTVQIEFEYPVFEYVGSKEVDYMLKGHKVKVPMSCIEEVILEREELYD